MNRKKIGVGKCVKKGTAKSKGLKKLGKGKVSVKKPTRRKVKVKNIA